MVDIAGRSCGATLGLVYDIYHIARSLLRLIRNDYRIATHDGEPSTSYGSSIRPSMSFTIVRMQLIRGHAQGRG